MQSYPSSSTEHSCRPSRWRPRRHPRLGRLEELLQRLQPGVNVSNLMRGICKAIAGGSRPPPRCRAGGDGQGVAVGGLCSPACRQWLRCVVAEPGLNLQQGPPRRGGPLLPGWHA